MSKAPQLQNRIRFLAPLGLALVILSAADTKAQRVPVPKRGLTNSSAVRTAFKPVVAQPSQATVRILADNKEIALGTIVGSDGWVLTKASQLKGHITCRLKDDRTLDARIVGIHKDTDLAMLKIEAKGLPTAKWTSGPDPAVGAWLATPGLGDTPVAVGVLSVRRRRIPPQRGVLGIEIEKAQIGPRITRVFLNSGAAKAGLKVGDVILRVSGNVVKTRAAVSSQLRKLRPGDSLTLRIQRSSREIDIQATLGYPMTSILNRGALQNRIGGRLSTRRAGFPAALQHDTVLRPEDCGGPLVDLNGHVVGINIARAGRTESFAIPTSEILPLLDDLKSGKLAPPVLQNVRVGPAPPKLPEDPADG